MVNALFRNVLFLLGGLFCLAQSYSCSTDRSRPSLAFYYWRTDLSLNPDEAAVLSNNDSGKLYVRYFDIVYNEVLNEPLPVAPVKCPGNVYKGVIVPVLFIKNNVFRELDAAGNDTLVQRTVSLLDQMNRSMKIQVGEIQVDCDWTAGTAKTYFQFLRSLRRQMDQHAPGSTIQSPSLLSATIRLHQVKYPDRQGIPPVDKGVLMLYNMGKIDGSTESSIYTRAASRNYLPALSAYRLPLDIALPVFAWGIHLREGQVVQLLNKMDRRNFLDEQEFRLLRSGRYQAVHSFFKEGFYFRAGDEVKIEEVLPADLENMAADIRRYYKKKVSQVIFYDLDSINISRYEQDIFKKTVAAF